ncbi:hypothetical protein M3231_12115 [Neobacillus mesonae]|nr:hypothetical protein [Neobacillus mesonae]
MRSVSLTIFLLLFLFCTACTNESKVDVPEPDHEIVENDPPNEQESESPFDVKNIKIPYNRYSQPCTAEGKVYIPVNNEKERLQNSILEYDLETEDSEIIYNSELEKAAINDLTCSSEWMIWAETDEFGLNGSIHAWDRKRDEKFVVFKYDDPEIMALDAPRLYKNMVAWVSSANNKPEVILYNLELKKQTVIANLKLGSFYNNTVDFYEDKLLWTDTLNNAGVYYIYNTETEEITEYRSSSPFVGYAQLLEDDIIAINFKDVSTWSTGKLGSFHIDNNELSLIEQDFINQLDSFDNHTAYITKNQELVYYDISSNEKVDLISSMNHTVDSVDFTNEGYLIAGYRSEDFSELFIFMFNT